MNNKIKITKCRIILRDDNDLESYIAKKLLVKEEEETIMDVKKDIYGSIIVTEIETEVVTTEGKKVKIINYQPLLVDKKIIKKTILPFYDFEYNGQSMEPEQLQEWFKENKLIIYDNYEFKTQRYENWIQETSNLGYDVNTKTQNIQLTLFI
jgi:hypothetical protein